MNNVLIKNLPDNDRPRERLMNVGVKNISNEDLISIILKTGTKNKSVKELSNIVLSTYKGINNMRNIEVNTITKINGIGKVKALELIAAIELGRRVYYEKQVVNRRITNSNDIYEFFYNMLSNLKQEHFYALYLDNKKNIIDKRLLYIGTINGSIAHPREIFKNAYLMSASFIVCVHNHPSGDPNPSKEDINITLRLKECGKIMGIELLDHIIIGNNKYVSLKEKGII